MQLVDLMAALRLDPAAVPHEARNVVVTGVTHRAQWVQPGDLYVAIRGATVDGHSFLDQALERGATAVMGQGLPQAVACPVPYLTVPHAREALADAAAALAGYPSRRLGVVGVTGTEGKTTTSWLTRHLLRALGHSTGLLSTVGYELPDGQLRQFPAHFTTPEAPQVQELMAQMLTVGADSVVLEASSHALALDRVRAVDWDVAVWTHLTREHLDFHKTLEQYFAHKRRLVERAPFAVLNRDDSWFAQLTGIAPDEWTYSVLNDPAADWRAHDVTQTGRGLEFHLVSPLGEADAVLPMVGAFNVDNALAALAAAARLHLARTGRDSDPELLAHLLDGLAGFRGVPGRMELLTGPDLRVVIDFAHTPTSLPRALEACRQPGKPVWVVIGSAGGKRDPGKHRLLGAASAQLSERAYFTEDDPSGTPLEFLLGELAAGADAALAQGVEPGRGDYRVVPDRTQAIMQAITQAPAGATVLLAGKGPEDFMDRGAQRVPWSERDAAERALAARKSAPQR